MGQIASSYSIMPESMDINLDDVLVKLATVLPVGVKLLETRIEPVAFGLKKIVAGFLIEDADENIGSKLEDALKAVPGIENIECVTSTVL